MSTPRDPDDHPRPRPATIEPRVQQVARSKRRFGAKLTRGGWVLLAIAIAAILVAALANA